MLCRYYCLLEAGHLFLTCLAPEGGINFAQSNTHHHPGGEAMENIGGVVRLLSCRPLAELVHW